MAWVWSKRLPIVVLCCLIIFVVVSASVTEQVLINPLLEVGHLWFQAASTVQRRVLDAVFTIPDPYDWKTYVYISLLLVAVRAAYLILIKPLNRVRKLGDTGYIAEGSFSVKETANYVQRRRKVGSVPPVYPNGWFGIMESFYVEKGQAVSVSMLGLNLAVFRDEQGVAHALDAYCPHMGANLAAGGRVIGDCLECPFHAWRFRGQDGKCTKIPYAEKIGRGTSPSYTGDGQQTLCYGQSFPVPDIAKVKSWPVDELNGWIYLWYHAEGAEPSWRLPELPDISSGKWVYRGRAEHIINAHIEEIPENGADVSHLKHVHGPIIGAGIDLRYMWSKAWSFAQHQWSAAWEPLPAPNGHIGQLKLQHSITVFGVRLPFFDLQVTAQQIGPGVVYLMFESVFGKGVFVQGLTPVEPMMQKLVHNIYASWTMPIPIAKFYMLGEALQVERDVMIWNNKQYEGKPLFVKSKEDSLISRHRRWYAQFYSENSPRLHFQKDSMEW